MIIKKIAFGSEKESFIEDKLTDDLNIIFSDDNNRGKTLVMQGLMYSLGYEAIFPSSFNYKDQYFYSRIEIAGNFFDFLRKNNSLAVKTEEAIQIFNSITEFRYFFDRHISPLPRITKENKVKMVDFSLFYEMFFIGQDNRNPSGLISKGQFNKVDFKNMIFSLAGLISHETSIDDINEIKEKINRLKIELKTIRKKITIIKSNPNIAEITSKTFDLEKTQEKIKILKKINENISVIKRSRQREINRKAKLETLVSELNSLNRGLNEGVVKCGDCGSDKIFFSNNDLTFDISNTEVRNSILKSIQSNIFQKAEIINEYTENLNIEQDSLNKELESSPADFQQIIVYQDHILTKRNYDDEALNTHNRIKNLETELNLQKSVQDDNKKEKKKLQEEILAEMMRTYKAIEPNGTLIFDDIFTKKDLTFSGSEGQEYYFSRLIALSNILKHEFPIIVDSFRDGELSTQKEYKMINIYKGLKKQIILTSTLKKEEYITRKYHSESGINALDYSKHNDCKILQKKYNKQFKGLIESFEGIVI